MQIIDPILASFDTTPSPHRRITAPRLVVAFAHIHGEARREHQLWVSGVRWWVGRRVRFCVQKGCLCMQIDPILASFDTTPSPHRRVNAPSLVLAFAHIHGEAGTPALGIWSALAGRKKGPFLCAGRVDFHAK